MGDAASRSISQHGDCCIREGILLLSKLITLLKIFVRKVADTTCKLSGTFRALQLEVKDEFLAANFLIDAVLEFIGFEAHVLLACSLQL
jgi:hypothetical protein